MNWKFKGTLKIIVIFVSIKYCDFALNHKFHKYSRVPIIRTPIVQILDYPNQQMK